MSWASRNNDPKRKLGAKQHKVTLDVMEGLRGLMKRKNVKQTDLAGRLGKTRAWISKLLHGGQNVTLFTVVEMADALGFDVRVDFVPHETAHYEIKDWRRSVNDNMELSAGMYALQTVEFYAATISVAKMRH